MTRILVAFCFAIWALYATAVNAQFSESTDHFYGATSNPNVVSGFYTINPATGAATLTGSIGFERVSAMDFHPTTGVLYATGERPGTDTGVLIRIDPFTGIGTEIGPTGAGVNASWAGLSFRSDGTLFAFHAQNDPVHTLFTIDTTTGAATIVGETGLANDGGNAIAFVGGSLYHNAHDSGLNTLNQLTGVATNVGAVTYPGGVDGQFSDMDTDSTGALFGLVKTDIPAVTSLMSLDVTTRVATNVGDTGVVALDAFAIRNASSILVFDILLNGANEAPPNASPGTGTGTVTFDLDLVTMRVEADFSGLIGNITAAHIHAPTAMPFTGTAGVATQTPTFTGFPSGVTAGMYDHTFDMTMASSFNAPFITANGGTALSAFNALVSAAVNGRAYLNLHSTAFPGGEIRGFLVAAPVLTVVVPGSVATTRGVYVSGDAASLADSDNADYVIRRLGTDIQSRTEFEVLGTSPTASPASLEVTLEGSVFARSTVVQTIELRNYVAATWELVDTRNATNMVDSTATVVATGDLSRFVDQATFTVDARIHFQSTSPRQRFSSNTDQFIWTIGQ